MRLIHSNQIAFELKKSFENSSQTILVTAYLTSGIFAVLNKNNLSDKKVCLYFRGNKQDFVNRTVCIETVRALYALGIHCYLVRNLHSKIYIFDDEIMYIGSANLTNNGLSVSASSNIEVLYKAEYKHKYQAQLDESLKYAVKLTDDILCEIEKSVINTETQDELDLSLDSVDWSFWSKQEYIDGLSYSGLPRCNLLESLDLQSDENCEHDQFLFGLKKDGSFERTLFIESSLHQFLVKELITRPDGWQFIRFGELKNILSNEFGLERYDAERFTKNIFSYYKTQNCAPLSYERFNYTESLKLDL